MTRGYSRQEVLEAIDGSGGIVMVVASRLKCAWHTAQAYIEKWESTKQAFVDEDEGTLDRAVSLIRRNIDIGLKKQQDDGEIVDSADAKWLLARKGKHRGYSERTEISGPGEGGEIVIKNVELTSAERKAALAGMLGLPTGVDGPDDQGDDQS